jgi:hypothetical protein
LLNEIVSRDLVSITKQIRITVAGGKGSYAPGYFPTFGKTVKGTVRLVLPKEGRWHVVAYDEIAKKNIKEVHDAQADTDYDFSYETNWRGITPKISFEWSKGADTTATVDISMELF